MEDSQVSGLGVGRISDWVPDFVEVDKKRVSSDVDSVMEESNIVEEDLDGEASNKGSFETPVHLPENEGLVGNGSDPIINEEEQFLVTPEYSKDNSLNSAHSKIANDCTAEVSVDCDNSLNSAPSKIAIDCIAEV